MGDLDSPKHGKIDPENAPHVGGNQWAGGTGGRDTAGLGGVGGPYRLDAGHDVHQVRGTVPLMTSAMTGGNMATLKCLIWQGCSIFYPILSSDSKQCYH